MSDAHKQNPPSKARKLPKGPPIPRQPYSRMNFLYQASVLLSVPSTSSQLSPEPTSPTTNTTKTPPPPPQQHLNPPLSRFYLSTLRTVAQKNVLRIHPSIKRSICKRCEAHLVPGVSCVVESGDSGGSSKKGKKKKKGRRRREVEVLVVRCLGCAAVKRFPVGTGWEGRGEGEGEGEGDGWVGGGGEEEKGKEKGYTLWCEREGVLEGVVVGGGGGSGAAGGTGK